MRQGRLAKLREYLKQENLGACLVSKPENIRYLSSFSSGEDARLVISSDQQFILTDARYYEQAQQECPEWELAKTEGSWLDSLASICDNYNSLMVESHYITFNIYSQLKEKLCSALFPRADVLEQFRAVKDEQELSLLREAAEIGDQVFKQICSEVKVGYTEKQISNRIAFLLKDSGCDREAFATIAVAGENAALPHGIPGSRPLKSGDMLTLDFGGLYQGYVGDMTRTVAVGEAPRKFREIYKWVKEAQELGISLIKNGKSCRDIDQQVREKLKKHRIDKYFVHGTGHGVGLEIHEAPVLSSRSDSLLLSNMVVTVEPGVYVPGWGGIRIEDTVIVTDEACEIITHADKSLIII